MSTRTWVEVGPIIRQRRDQLGLTQEEAAERSGQRVSTVNWRIMEKGASANPREPTKIGLARALEWPDDAVDRLLEGADPSSIERVKHYPGGGTLVALSDDQRLDGLRGAMLTTVAEALEPLPFEDLLTIGRVAAWLTMRRRFAPDGWDEEMSIYWEEPSLDDFLALSLDLKEIYPAASSIWRVAREDFDQRLGDAAQAQSEQWYAEHGLRAAESGEDPGPPEDGSAGLSFHPEAEEEGP